MDRGTWLSGFRTWLERTPAPAVAACFPVYRPELVTALASSLDMRLYDFRKERMAPLGWQAGSLPLSTLEEAAAEAMVEGRGVVLQNVESLLAVHSATVRREALTGLLARAWPQRLILPLALYSHDLPQGVAAYVFEASALPDESLLLRLAGVQ